MSEKNLFKRAGELGYPLLESEGAVDVNRTLADVVKSKNLRLWEGFPVLFANSAERRLFSYNDVEKHLKKSTDKRCLMSLMVMSLALYKILKLKFSWATVMHRSLSQDRKTRVTELYGRLGRYKDFKVGNKLMSAQRVKNAFMNYFGQSQAALDNLAGMKDELGVEYFLSQVFSPKQKELFLKRLKREKLSKTEKEYFSRAVKKKVLALANPELHRLARKILE